MTKNLLWDESLETGIVEIDIQHRTLFNIFKILSDAIENKKSSMVIKYIIDEIERYGGYHIDAEEKILRKYNIIEDHHLHEHDSFKNIVGEFKEKYLSTRDRVLAIEIHQYLYDWVTNHIMVADMESMNRLKQEFKRLGKGEYYGK
jgi:hemerythrin-like metal-binding protein